MRCNCGHEKDQHHPTEYDDGEFLSCGNGCFCCSYTEVKPVCICGHEKSLHNPLLFDTAPQTSTIPFCNGGWRGTHCWCEGWDEAERSNQKPADPSSLWNQIKNFFGGK
jgi:hypothetical protein